MVWCVVHVNILTMVKCGVVCSSFYYTNHAEVWCGCVVHVNVLTMVKCGVDV